MNSVSALLSHAPSSCSPPSPSEVLPPSEVPPPSKVLPRNGQLLPIGAILTEVLRRYELSLPVGGEQEVRECLPAKPAACVHHAHFSHFGR